MVEGGLLSDEEVRVVRSGCTTSTTGEMIFSEEALFLPEWAISGETLASPAYKGSSPSGEGVQTTRAGAEIAATGETVDLEVAFMLSEQASSAP